MHHRHADPAAGPRTYSLTPDAPEGLTFNATNRTLTGTPTESQSATTYTYTVTDNDGDAVSLTFDITIAEDKMPTFGTATVENQTYTQNTEIATLTLPQASNGDIPLTYTLTPNAPDGLTFDATNRTLTGTPTTAQRATQYTYTATDDDGDTATLTFNITVEALPVPAAPTGLAAAAGNARVVLTWTDPSNDSISKYQLRYGAGSSVPSTETWADIPNSGATTVRHEITGLTNDTQYAFEIRAVNNTGEGAAAGPVTATPSTNTTPSFGTRTVADQSYVQNTEIATLTLPQAEGGDAPLTYSLAPDAPDGLTFNATNRTLTGTPTASQSATTYTYTVSDNDGDAVSLTFDITIAEDKMPTFGTATVENQTYTQNTEIATLTLPQASNGDIPLTYTLTPNAPAGLTFNATNRTLTGTPTTAQRATQYTYTATDDDGDTATLTFNITVEALPVPSAPTGLAAAAGNARVVLTWTDPGNDSISKYQVRYGAGSSVPATETWADIPNSGATTVRHEITGLTNDTQYAFEIRAVNNTGEGAAAGPVTATPSTNTTPSFGTRTVADQSYVQNTEIATLTLPQAEGGDAPLTYSLAPDAPDGLAFNATNRTLTGTPTASQSATTYTYTVTDNDGDAVSLTFTITIAEDKMPTFGTATVENQTYTQNTAITTLNLPAASDGDIPLTYTLTPNAPAGLTFNATNRTLTGTPTTAQPATQYTYTATDDDGDTATLTFTITVEALPVPAAPTGLAAAAGNARVILTWTDPGNDSISKYQVRYGAGASVPATETWADIPNSGATTVRHEITGLTNDTQYAFEIRAVNATGEGAAAGPVTATPSTNTTPSFGTRTVADQNYVQNTEIATLTLPQAEGGDAPLTYSLTPDAPDGLTFNATNRTLTGTPTASQSATTYTYTVTDNDGDAVSLTFTITIAEDKMPTFGAATVENQTYTQNTAITTLNLPAASDGDIPLTYTLTPNAPAGLTFNATNRTLTGTPTTAQPATQYTYTATDDDGDTATLTFTITVEALPVPAAPTGLAAAAGNARVVLTWTDPSNDSISKYQLRYGAGSSVPSTETWADIPGSGATTVRHEITGLTNDTQYAFEIRAVNNTGEGAAAGPVTATPSTNTTPSFGTRTVADQSYVQNTAIATLTLPQAEGGDAPLTYSLAPDAPDGLTFNATNRTLTGTPTASQSATTYTYTVSDNDGDAVSLTFDITIAEDKMPTFGTATVENQTYTQNTEIATLTLPQASNGDIPLTYTLTPNAPDGLTFDATNRTLTGTPTTAQRATQYTYTATDDDGDTATLTFNITVEALPVPSAPSGLAAAAGNARVVLTWTDPDNDSISKYQVRYGAGSSVPSTETWADIPNSGATTVRHEITGLTNDTQYAFEIRAVNATGEGAAAGPVTATPSTNTTPSFGTRTVADQSYVQNTEIATLTLPQAEGGDAPLTYSLAPDAPEGLTFNARRRTLSGTPTASQAATAYTYTVTDNDGSTASLTFTITIAEDKMPTFGPATVENQTYTQNTEIATLTLPQASNGDIPLTYTLTPNAPDGLTFNATNRTLTGTPTTAQRATAYTYTATDDDGDTATLTFNITVEALPVPAAPTGLAAAAGNARVILTWTDPDNDSISKYQLRYGAGSSVPSTETWADIPGSGATTVRHEITGLTNDTQYAFEIRAVNATGEGAAAGPVTATPSTNTTPSFGTRTVADQSYVQNTAITPLTLPQAEGGDAPLTYSLSPDAPDGLTFNATSRTLTGTPTGTQSATTYTYTVTDNDGDAVSLTFDITITADKMPTFAPATVENQTYIQDTEITTLNLPAASDGDAPLTYSLTPNAPDGLTFDATNRTLTGTPTGTQAATAYTYTVTDEDGDTATLTFTITIEANRLPSFGALTIDDQTYTENTAIADLTLPAATGGDIPLTYTLTPDAPVGLTFNATNRTLSGTPTAAQSATTYTYTATDTNGDAVSLTFSITISAEGTPNNPPTVANPIGDRTVTVGSELTVQLETAGSPVFTDADGHDLRYTATSDDETNVTVAVSDSALTVTGVAVGSAEVTVTANDSNGGTASTAFTVTVSSGGGGGGPVNRVPTFGDQTIDDQSYTQDEAITALTLPAATGGNGVLTYSISPELPAGLSFDAETRTLSGTPTEAQSATTYTYTVEDSDDNRDSSDAATLTFAITIEAAEDSAPSFGDQTIDDQTYTQDEAITALTLPAATGGNGTLTYSISPELPAGLSFDAATRTLSGTPTEVQEATTYTYTVEDSDDNRESSDAATLTFAITIEAGEDSAPSFGDQTIDDQTYTQDEAITALTLPAATGGNGTLTYSISPELPAGLSFDAATRTLSGTPTEVQEAVTYTYTVEDSDDNRETSDAATLTFAITIEAAEDSAPSFGDQTIDDQTYTQDEAITALTLPAATGGNGTLTYSITPELPAGLSFDAATRTLSGTPTEAQSATTYTYTVEDSDDNRETSDEATLTFAITIEAPEDSAPSFGDQTIDDQTYTQDEAIMAVTLPAATGGNGTLTYSITPALPAGLSFDAATRMLSGTPTEAQSATTYTYTVEDADDNRETSDEATLTFAITIEAPEDSAPSFGDQTIDDQTYTQDEAIMAVTLPAATGGNGTLTYSITPALPAGLSFDAATRMLSGTPTEAQSATTYTYTAEDADDNREASDAATLTFAITVSADNQAPVVDNPLVDLTVTAGTSATVDLSGVFSDPDLDSLTLSAVSGDTGIVTVSLSGTTLTVSGLAAGSATVTVTATDSSGATVEDTFNVTVVAVSADDQEALEGWLTRFGRAVAEQALDGVAERMAAPRTAGSEGAVGGATLMPGDRFGAEDGAPWNDIHGEGDDSALFRGATVAGTGLQNQSDNMGVGNSPDMERDLPHSQTLGIGEVLRRSSFTLTGKQDANGGNFALWGRAAESRFSGRDGEFTPDGELTSGMLGLDYGTDSWLAGVAVAQSSGKGSAINDYALSAEQDDEEIKASLISAIPYGSIQATERIKLWGAAGFGSGEMTLRPGNGQLLKSDLSWTMAAGGARGDLFGRGSRSGLALALTSDALWARTKLDEALALPGSQGEISRIRLGLEGSWAIAVGNQGSAIVPKLEIGGRHDGGDAETGTGVEVGGGLAWTVPTLGLELSFQGRTLVSHSDDDFENSGYAVSFLYRPNPVAGLGPSLTLTQDWGGPATGGLDALFAKSPLESRHGYSQGGRYTAEAAYGLRAFRGRFISGPQMRFGGATGSMEYGFGWFVAPTVNAPNLSVGLMVMRSESDGIDPVHGVRLEFSARW